MQVTQEVLINYLDGQLSTQEAEQIDIEIKENAKVASEVYFLKLALTTIQNEAINQKVASVKQLFDQNKMDTRPIPLAPVKSMFKYSMRVAAVVFLIAGLTMIYKYTSVNSSSLYDRHFVEYTYSNARGLSDKDPEITAYQNKNWEGVLTAFTNKTEKTNKSMFIAAMANMELKKFPEAILLFETISKSNDLTFKEESEYYLSLAYLRTNQNDMAARMLNQIKSDTSHSYYQEAKKISSLDLKIIDIKK